MGSDNESGGEKGSAPLIQAFPNRVDPFFANELFVDEPRFV